jgi:uncharacterized membrane protein
VEDNNDSLEMLVVFTLVSMWKENRFGSPLRGIIWFTIAIVGSCAVIAVLAGYVQKARSVEKVTNRVKTVGFYFLLRLESKKPRPRPINKDRTG